MRLLYLHGEARLHNDVYGRYYTSGTYNEDVWNRYLSICDELRIVFRKDNELYPAGVASKKFNSIPNQANCIALPDVYKPYTNYINKELKKRIDKVIEKEVYNADRIIIRSLCDYYSNTALKWCRIYKKKYLVEVISFEFEQLFYHSFLGKIIAPFNEFKYRLLMKQVPYAVYVTRDKMQKRYPTNGKMIGCSDVEIESYSEETIKNRIKRIEEQKTIVVGTAASLDVHYKKQELVVKAIAYLKEKMNINIEYQLVGSGKGVRIMNAAVRNNISNQLKIIGEIPHKEMNRWYDQVDIYIQPSYVEGVSRAIVEAMSRACPIICADIGGNSELITKEWLYKKSNFKRLAFLMSKMIDKNTQKEAAMRNWVKAEDYSKRKLDCKRSAFYNEFMQE